MRRLAAGGGGADGRTYLCPGLASARGGPKVSEKRQEDDEPPR
jgi:hypothetical protein